jgi:hypothetical protein
VLKLGTNYSEEDNLNASQVFIDLSDNKVSNAMFDPQLLDSLMCICVQPS